MNRNARLIRIVPPNICKTELNVSGFRIIFTLSDLDTIAKCCEYVHFARADFLTEKLIYKFINKNPQLLIVSFPKSFKMQTPLKRYISGNGIILIFQTKLDFQLDLLRIRCEQ